MVVLDKNLDSVIGNMPLVLELDDKVAVNGQLYDKTSLKPYPFEFFAVPDADNDINMNNVINNCGNFILSTGNYGSYFWNTLTSTFENNCIIDNIDPNIIYVTIAYSNTKDAYANQDTRIYKLRKNGNNYEQLGVVINQYYRYKILFQTNDYIYGNYTWANSSCGAGWSNSVSYENSGLFSIRKQDFSLTHNYCSSDLSGIFAYGWVNNVNFLCMDNKGTAYLSIYGAYRPDYETSTSSNYYASFWIVRIDLNSNKVISNQSIFSNIVNYPYIIMSDCIEIDGYYYLLADFGFTSNSTHRIEVIRVNIREDGFPLYIKMTSIDPNNFMQLNTRPQTYTHYHMQAIKANGKTYLYYVVSGTGSAYSKNNYLDHEIVVLEVVDNTVVCKNLISIGEESKGVLKYQNSNNIIVLTKSSLLFYTFDSYKETFVRSNQLSKTFKSVGFDTLGRLWTLDTNSKLEILSCPSPILLQADFEEELYDYVGDDIETNVFCYAKDYLDKYTSANVILNLYGDVYFKDNGLKSIKVATSMTGMINVPVIIKGYGTLEVYISEVF